MKTASKITENPSNQLSQEEKDYTINLSNKKSTHQPPSTQINQTIQQPPSTQLIQIIQQSPSTQPTQISQSSPSHETNHKIDDTTHLNKEHPLIVTTNAGNYNINNCRPNQ
jgi:hypothetical protein